MKSQLLSELKKTWIPNFELFKSSEALILLPDLLNELLSQEIADFERILEKNAENLTFDELFIEGELGYLRNILNFLNSTEKSPEIRKIIQDFRAKYEDFLNQIAYSKKYYEVLSDFSKRDNLNADQIRILELEIKYFKQRGIDLDEKTQEQIKEINKKTSEISEKIQNNVTDEQSHFFINFPDNEFFSSLPKDISTMTKKASKGEKMLTFDANPSGLQAILKYCDDPEIRKTIYLQLNQWASKGEYSNKNLIFEFLSLRQNKAQLLGYENFAHQSLENKMASSPAEVKKLIWEIAEKAKLKAKNELELLKSTYNLTEINPRDLAYYARKYKEEFYSFDEEELRQYFEFDHVLDWLFEFVKNFLGVEMRKIKKSEWPSAIFEYEVYFNDTQIAFFVLDPFYRAGKRQWAWADILREKDPEFLPLVINVENFSENRDGKTLLYKRDVETLFHEFGHALHAMLADSRYAQLNGFNVERDFVELPSQLMENWVKDQEALKSLAKHSETWEQIPFHMLQTQENLQTRMMGNFVLRQCELALVDMSIYDSELPTSSEELENSILEISNRYSLFPRGQEYQLYCSFLHIFWGWYGAGYYSYMRAELLEADVFQKIKENWIFSPQIWNLYRDKILAQGCRKPARELFSDFMWRDPDSKALMKKYWLIDN